jgi:hypothetical protein
MRGTTRHGCLAEAALASSTQRVVDCFSAPRFHLLWWISDNGTEFTSNAILRWSKEQQVEW